MSDHRIGDNLGGLSFDSPNKNTKKDGIFNKETATSFKDNILSKGNTDHPMNLYKNFMGREPIIKSLLIKSGLLSEENIYEN